LRATVYRAVVAADAPPPVAIRVTRPYANEDEYLEHELEMLTRASVTLVGAQPRAEGVVLRFELVLASGHVLLRGEGRVIGFKPNALQGAGGLSLRFTRVDTRSKALIDRAATLRDRRRPSQRPRMPDPGSQPSIFPARPSIIPARPSNFPARPSIAPAPISTDPFPPAPISTDPFPLAPISTDSVPLAPVSTDSVHADRDALLARLRARAKTLDPAAVRRILALRGFTWTW
jgi:hypothetical protein